MRIIDAHQHFWDLSLNKHPWLTEAGKVSFRYGDYAAIRRDYLPDAYRRDTMDFEIAGSVYIEAEWDAADPVGEMAWIDALRADGDLPSVCVAQAWFHHGDIAGVLEAHAAFPFVRGVRHKPPEPAGFMDDTAWRDGYALLSRHGFSFDLQTPWSRLEEAYRLARDFPDTVIILNHTGLPADRSRDGLAGWRAALRRFAEAPNVAVKISGIGVPQQPWTVESNRGIVLDTIGAFGVERCMFASNFPVDGLVGSFRNIFGGLLEITAELSRDERSMLFHDNAVRYYRIGEPG